MFKFFESFGRSYVSSYGILSENDGKFSVKKKRDKTLFIIGKVFHATSLKKGQYGSKANVLHVYKLLYVDFACRYEN